VVLTLNIEPPKNASELKHLLPAEAYREYKNRRAVTIRQYGFHELLPCVEHHAAGRLPGEQYVALADMLAFVQAMGWGDTAPFLRGMTCVDENRSPSDTSAVTTYVDFDFDELPKGHRYTTVRMGAILTLLEKWLLKPGGQIPEAIRKGDTLNYTELARQVNAVIAAHAKEHNKAAFSAFGVEVLRKEFSESRKALDAYFL
jgi:hypothetical protein